MRTRMYSCARACVTYLCLNPPHGTRSSPLAWREMLIQELEQVVRAPHPRIRGRLFAEDLDGEQFRGQSQAKGKESTLG